MPKLVKSDYRICRGNFQMIEWKQVCQEIKGHQRKRKSRVIPFMTPSQGLCSFFLFFDFAFLLTGQVMGIETRLDANTCTDTHAGTHTHTHTQLLLPRPFTQSLQLPVQMTVGTKNPAVNCNFLHAYITTCKF